jgi:hypothetical protein
VSYLLSLLLLLSTGLSGVSLNFQATSVAAASLRKAHTLLPNAKRSENPYVGSCPSTQYTDVHTSDYFYDPVWYLCAFSAVFGYTGSTCGAVGSPCYLPYYNSTRADLIRAVIVAQSDDSNWSLVSDVQAFADVIPDGYMSRFIETAAYHGIINGYPCGGVGEPCIPPRNLNYFRPSNVVTRGQAAKIITLAEGWRQVYPSPPTFTDVPSSHTFWSYIETANYYNLMTGYYDATHCGSNIPCFRPDDPVKRGQTAKFVYLAKEGNFQHSDNYAGSNNWVYLTPPCCYPYYMEPRGFLFGSNPATYVYQGEGRQIGWSNYAISWMQDPSRTDHVYVTMHTFLANTNNCGDEDLLGGYSFTNINSGIAPVIKNSCSPIALIKNEIRFQVDPSYIIPNLTGYVAQAAFNDNHYFVRKYEYDITSYYEGIDQYHKDDMRKFCYYENTIGFPDNTGACHQ